MLQCSWLSPDVPYPDYVPSFGLYMSPPWRRRPGATNHPVRTNARRGDRSKPRTPCPRRYRPDPNRCRPLSPTVRRVTISRRSPQRRRSRPRAAYEQMSGRCRECASAGRTRPRDHHDHDAVDRIPRRVGAGSGRLDQEMSTIAPGGRTTNRDSREPDGPDSDLARSIAPGA